MTQLQRILIDKYAPNGPKCKQGRMALLSIGMGAREYGFENEILEYLKVHPYATLRELEDFAEPFFPEIEIVDDDEMDEEDE